MPIGVKTLTILIKLKCILFPKNMVVLFAQVMSSLISGILCYKALNWLFSAIETFITLISGIIPWNTVSIYWSRTKYWVILVLFNRRVSYAIKNTWNIC